MSCPALIPTVAQRAGRLGPDVLPRVLVELLDARPTGLLELRRFAERLTLRLINGELVGVPAGAPVSLEEILVERGFMIRRDLGRGLAQARSQGRRLSLVLCEMGLVRRESLDVALRAQLEAALAEALSWEEGTYSFEPDDTPTPLEDLTLGVPTRELLREAAFRRVRPAVAARPDDGPAATELRREIRQAVERVRGRSHFEILGVLRQAGPEELRETYRRLVRRFHPDALSDPALADLRESATEVFHTVTEAYNALGAFEPVAPLAPPPRPQPVPVAAPAAPAMPEGLLALTR